VEVGNIDQSKKDNTAQEPRVGFFRAENKLTNKQIYMNKTEILEAIKTTPIRGDFYEITPLLHFHKDFNFDKVSPACNFFGGDFFKGNFDGGDFYGGKFHGGDFRGGFFYGGLFDGGEFRDGAFYGGDFHGGEFYNGTFYNGRFHGGYFHFGTFKGGRFHGGHFYEGTFLEGTFTNGNFHGGNFCFGAFAGGDFVSGTFAGGTFERGTWHDSDIRISNWFSSKRMIYINKQEDLIVTGCFSGTYEELLQKAENDKKGKSKEFRKLEIFLPKLKKKVK
jgi:uncharacterized protein YjbI with pentapeptide repeats